MVARVLTVITSRVLPDTSSTTDFLWREGFSQLHQVGSGRAPAPASGGRSRTTPSRVGARRSLFPVGDNRRMRPMPYAGHLDSRRSSRSEVSRRMEIKNRTTRWQEGRTDVHTTYGFDTR
jgi:hypothetical protein